MTKQLDGYQKTINKLLDESDLLRQRILELEAKSTKKKKHNPPQKREGGLSQTDLCLKFGLSATNIARNAKVAGKNTQAYLTEKTGYLFDQGTKLYYPPPSQ